MAAESTGPVEIPRRNVVCGMLALGVLGTGVLAGCGGDEEAPSSADSTTAAGDASSAPAPSASQTSGTATGGKALAQLADVPVGGGVVVVASSGSRVVLTQPTAGTVKAFQAACTHQGTTVRAPQNGVITCPNHGSQFNASDGAVRRGPAKEPLPAVTVKVEGQNIVEA
jgi:cytochrome b6-f complex iron-sulfur subunit